MTVGEDIGGLPTHYSHLEDLDVSVLKEEGRIQSILMIRL